VASAPYLRVRGVSGARIAVHHSAHAAAPAELNRLATSATNQCLTGCVIGEVTGMSIATALGWGDVASIALAVGLAFLFGYSLTSLPLLRARLPFAAIVPIALAADTVSIAKSGEGALADPHQVGRRASDSGVGWITRSGPGERDVRRRTGWRPRVRSADVGSGVIRSAPPRNDLQAGPRRRLAAIRARGSFRPLRWGA
jgi:hypothetical protein